MWGGYDEVLNSHISIGQLIDSTIHLLDPKNTLSSSATIVGLKAIKFAAGSTTVILGDILKIQGSTASSATQAGMFRHDQLLQ